MNEKTNYGKIIAITLAVITSACTIAFVIYRLFRNLIKFCNTYTVSEAEEPVSDLCEMEEEICEDAPEEEAPTAEPDESEA